MVETVVVNVRKEGHDIYIGRGSKWGNPFTIGFDGDRFEVIEKYKSHIKSMLKIDKSLDLYELKGKRLGCHCAPLPCHGDVLKDLVCKLR